MNISSVMNTAASGMRMQTNRVGAIADNLANIDTPGYTPVGAAEGETVDPAAELTDMIEAEQSYKANAAVFETGADMWQVLMGIKRD